MGLSSGIGHILYFLRETGNKCLASYYKSKFKSCGSNVYIDRNCDFTPETTTIGNNVYIGPNSSIRSTHGSISIGNHVLIGPSVQIHGGNHERKTTGIFLDQEKKQKGQDPDLIIEDDVWIGANAIILKGVHIGRGAMIGAGTIVTKDVPPYAIVVGNPGRVLSYVFTPEQVKEHEKLLYPENNRTNLDLMHKTGE